MKEKGLNFDVGFFEFDYFDVFGWIYVWFTEEIDEDEDYYYSRELWSDS